MENIPAEKTKLFPCIWQAIVLLFVTFVILVILSIGVGILQLIFKMMGLSFLVEFLNQGKFYVNLALIPISLGIFYFTKQSLAKIFDTSTTKIYYFLPLLVVIFGSTIIGSEMDNCVRYLFPMPEWLQKIFKDMIQGPWMSFVLLVIMASLTEELLFRGVILRAFLSRYRKITAIIVSAAMFSFFHLNIYQMFSPFVLGLLIGWIYAETNSLYLCFFVHSTHNFLSWACAFKLINVYIPGYTHEGEVDFNVVQFQPLWFNITGVVMLAIGVMLLHKLFEINKEAKSAGEDNKKIEEGSI